MKKISLLVMCLALLLSLCACGGGNEPVRGDQINHNEETTAPEESFSMGKIEGLTYESKFIGIGCNLPAGWSFYSDEQIRALNNATADMAGEDYQNLMENATLVYDMYATSADGLENVNVNMEKLNAVQILALDVEQNFLTVAPTLQSTMEGMGFTNYQYATGTVTIDGEEFVCLNTQMEIAGAPLYQTLIGVKCNGYLASITVTASSQENVSAILEGFYTI